METRKLAELKADAEAFQAAAKRLSERRQELRPRLQYLESHRMELEALGRTLIAAEARELENLRAEAEAIDRQRERHAEAFASTRALLERCEMFARKHL